jgi:hypothetical protein
MRTRRALTLTLTLAACLGAAGQAAACEEDAGCRCRPYLVLVNTCASPCAPHGYAGMRRWDASPLRVTRGPLRRPVVIRPITLRQRAVARQP